MTPTMHNLGINTFGLWTFRGSHFGVRWLDSALLACGLTQAPTPDASKNSQQTFDLHFEDKSLRNVRFKNAANLLVLVWGRCQASANENSVKPPHPKEPRPLSWLKDVQSPNT